MWLLKEVFRNTLNPLIIIFRVGIYLHTVTTFTELLAFSNCISLRVNIAD